MKKHAILLLVLALGVASCGASEVAATVDGTEITVGEVNDLLFDPGATTSKQEFAQYLGFLIQWTIAENAAAAEFGITPTEEEIQAEADAIFERFAQGATREEFLEQNNISEGALRRVGLQTILERAVEEELSGGIEPPTEEQVSAQMDLAFRDLAEVCVSHILVETLQEVKDVIGRLEVGDSFADVAMEVSLDTASGAEGGDLGCRPVSRYVSEFANATLEAEIDVVHGPVRTQFGYHLILLTDRTLPGDDELPTVEDLTEQLRQQAAGAAVNQWFLAALDAATVTVAEKFGVWSTSPQPGVLPPP